jgi:hypothetical protein
MDPGAPVESDDELRERLRALDDELAELRHELGPNSDEPRDFGDAGLAVRDMDEQQALIRALEARRERLLKQLGEK